MSFEEYKKQILDYLNKEKSLYEEDIRANMSLSDPEKVEAGLLIKSVKVVQKEDDGYILSTSENQTKLRPGDRVTLVSNDCRRFSGKVIENGTSTIILESPVHMENGQTYRLEVNEFVLLDPLISLIDSIELGMPGSDFIEILGGARKPESVGLLPIDNVPPMPERLNKSQRTACEEIIKCPTMFCLQGPPGTGKTDVLATLANIFAMNDCQVLILAKTHQAVNNALNKVKNSYPRNDVHKIGEELKAIDLDKAIDNFPTYNEYIKSRKKTGQSDRDVVGMTLQGAIVNLGLRHKGFLPYVVLIDEAGQIPLTEAACIGAFGAATIVFIGDEKQMPPIFHEKQTSDPLSISVFEYLCKEFPDFKQMLDVTYRMNEEITQYVSSRYYDNKLTASEYSKDRHLNLTPKSKDERINELLAPSPSIVRINVSEELHTDENEEEASFITDLVQESIADGMAAEDIAVITPFRRQVLCIREHLRNAIQGNIPLIDTVERLQGQDVDMIIISCTTTNEEYYLKNVAFLENPNRWNVMISRAKKKVIIIGKHFGC